LSASSFLASKTGVEQFKPCPIGGTHFVLVAQVRSLEGNALILLAS
jgi:hypothetical protein